MSRGDVGLQCENIECESETSGKGTKGNTSWEARTEGLKIPDGL